MSDENTTTATSKNTTNGAANGKPHGEGPGAREEDTAVSPKKRSRGRRDRSAPTGAAATAAPIESTSPPQSSTEASSSAPPEVPLEPPPEVPIEALPEVQVEALAEPTDMPTDTPTAATPIEDLRLRMKVWTDPRTAKRYLMPTAFMRDIVGGQPVTDAMYAYAMRDDDTKLVTLTAREWNALPFFYFRQDGPAPRATTRPVDVIR